MSVLNLATPVALSDLKNNLQLILGNVFKESLSDQNRILSLDRKSIWTLFAKKNQFFFTNRLLFEFFSAEIFFFGSNFFKKFGFSLNFFSAFGVFGLKRK